MFLHTPKYAKIVHSINIVNRLRLKYVYLYVYHVYPTVLECHTYNYIVIVFER